MIRFLLVIFISVPIAVDASTVLKKLSLLGDTSAQLRLAFKEINSVPPRWGKALPWLEMAAVRDEVIACQFLGIAYIYGKGVEKNFSKSVYWLELGALLGSVDCRKLLAIEHFKIGNNLKALTWKIIFLDSSSAKDVEVGQMKLIKPTDNFELEQAKLLAQEIRNTWNVRSPNPQLDPISYDESFGEISLAGGYFFKGNLRNNIPHGYGMKKIPNGPVYYGYFHNGVEHGYGTSFRKTGHISYQGRWNNGSPQPE
jgi:hypothetical protein